MPLENIRHPDAVAKKPPHSTQNASGVALLLALAVLTLLALLAAVFATRAATERAVARNALDAARARLIAAAGLETAVARLRTAARHGEDTNANGRLDPGEDADGNGALDGFLDDPRWTWGGAARPSFAATDPDGSPLRLRIDGTMRGISGALDVSTYAPGGDTFTLRIADTNASLHINGGLGRPADTERLRRVLNRLGKRRGVDVPALGDRLLAARPPAGFASLHALRDILTEAERARVDPFLTCHAWIDPAVANPVPVSAYEARRNGSPYAVRYPRPANADAPETSLYRFGRGVNVAGLPDDTPVAFHDADRPVGERDTHAAVYALDELHPQWIEVVPRAPVNVNAAPRELLAALIEGVQGFFVLGPSFSPFEADTLYAGPTTDPAHPHGNWFRMQLPWDNSRGAIGGGAFGHLHVTAPFTPEEAGDLADRIVAARTRRPFRTWAQFEDFLDGLVWHARHNPAGPIRDPRDGLWREAGARGPNAAGIASARRHTASRARADALKANFNPNLHLNELNPDAALARRIDKTDLIEASTELCFQPMGTFRIVSTGRVLAPADPAPGGFRTVAASRVTAVVRVWDAIRLTSMKDFWGTDGRSEAPEGAPPRPAGFLPADARLAGRGVLYNTNNNRALEIGPEPDNALDDADLVSLEYDGYVALATTGGCLPHSAYREGRTKEKWRCWRTRTSNYHPAGDLLHAHFQFDADAHYTAWTAFASRRSHLRQNFARRHDEGSWPWNFFNYADQPVLFQDGTSTPVRLWWPTRGPYCAADTAPPGYDVNPDSPIRETAHRVGRSFRIPPAPRDAGAGAPPSPAPPRRRAYPPQDLRIDGLYVERHSSVAYTAGPHEENFNPRRGAVAYWIKPAFAPEHTATVRKFFSVARMHGTGEAPEDERPLAIRHFNPTPFGHFYLPAPAADTTGCPLYGIGNGTWPSRAFAFGWGFSERGPTGTPWNLYRVADRAETPEEPAAPRLGAEGGVVTPSLNHVGYRNEIDGRRDPAGERRQNLLASHRWIHVLAAWDMTAPLPELTWRMWVNGRERPASSSALYRLVKQGPGYRFPAEPFSGDPPGHRRSWVYDDFGNPNPIRIGEPSRLEHAACPVPEGETIHCPLGHDDCTMIHHYAMNFVPDSTVDEFYVWGDPVLGVSQGLDRLWRVGRYYRGGDGWYLAPAIDLDGDRPPPLPPPGGTAPLPAGTAAEAPVAPTGAIPPPPPGSPAPGRAAVARPRPLALAWTAAAGAYDRKDDTLLLFDYQADPPVPRAAAIRAAVSTDGGKTWRGRRGGPAGDPRRLEGDAPWTDPGWSPLVVADGTPVEIGAPGTIRLALHFDTKTDPLNSILLESLVLDDLTLFYEPGRLEILEQTVE